MEQEEQEETKAMTTYLIVHKDRTERKITVPSDWKVTFGPAAAGFSKGTSGGPTIPLALRFYEDEKKQRAIFTDVVSFRDLSIQTEIKKTSHQEKQGFMECDGQRKATTFSTTVEEWINPDTLQKQPALPGGEDVESFDVEFTEINSNPKED